ncbi:MAG: gliding motility-associated ABC transporter substrate-binding protein GldG [Raineya sp.]|nr:gliding motility-associated ABC transporter substrate-binding protein GldG [Raineya sp.]MDW8296555.1 gliding motility-associated ABC transporter substrate-binding protein GldG [Raineya sp.]
MRKALKNFSIPFLLIVFYIFSQSFVFRIDLTEDKRYTISEATKAVLEGLEEEIFVKIYLEGDNLPANYRMFRNAIEENLQEFKRYAGKKLKFKFIDPLVIKSKAEKDTLFKHFQRNGINPTPVAVYKEGERSEKFIFPAAEIIGNQGSLFVSLLNSDMRVVAINEELEARLLNNAIENIEYTLIEGIYQITQKQQKRIGFIYGHGELPPIFVSDAAQTLAQKYEVFPVDLPQSPSLDGLDAIIVAKPTQGFSEEDKFKLDQFLMKGGKALFFIDALDIREDSINTPRGAVSIPYTELVESMTEFFFNYGIRFNMNFIEDVQNFGIIGLVVGEYAGKPKIETLPWRHYLAIRNFYKHPTTKNLEALWGRYVSSLDTVASAGKIKKIPLASSSPYSLVVPYPVIIKYDEARQTPDLEKYKKGRPYTLMYLLEGNFVSLYQKRILPSDARYKNFVPESQKPTKILVCADGDFLRNGVNAKTKQVLPLGYDKFTGFQFANKQFLLNILSYMLDEKGIILSRNKEIMLRPLDKKKLQNQRTFWQWFNVGLPVVFLIIFGIAWNWWRKSKYAA